MTALPAPTERADPARQRLRASTADLHARVDGLFPNGLDSVPTYHRYLLGMHRFAADYEAAIAAAPRHSAWLAVDLHSLALRPLPPVGVMRARSDPAARLGWQYVMAGSALGARQLVRDARRLGFRADGGACFLERHADGDAWSGVQAGLAALAEDGVARAIEGARAAFESVHACFARSFELFPATDARDEATA